MKNFFKSKKNRILIMSVLLLAFCTVGIVTYAKYYAQSAKNGIAVASGIYFTSNYLGETDDFKETVVTQEYAGGDYTIQLEVRNYENNLLFNESNMRIQYSIKLWLEKNSTIPQGVHYKVTYGNNSLDLKQGEEQAVTISGEEIAGGMVIKKVYNIEITTDKGVSNMTPVPVYAVVKTDAGSLINKTLKGKLTMKSATKKDFIESKEFIFPSLQGKPTDEQKLAEAKKLGGLTYEIRTVSDAINSGEVTEELRIKWKTSALEINQYDSYYLKAKAQGKTGTEGDMTFMDIEAMPYAAIGITFFKKDITAVTTLKELNDLVTVDKKIKI